MFKLQRYFSLTSLAAFLVVSVTLGYFYSWSATNNLMGSAEENHIILTRVFANSLWPMYADFANDSEGLSVDELLAHPETAKLYAAVASQTRNTSVIKVKIYNLAGLTIFSTEESQIGEDKQDNAGFIMASEGKVASELSHRDAFSAFEQVISDRDVLSSYIPIQRDNGVIEGVFEIYSDITPLLQDVHETRITVIGGVAGALSLLYLTLFVIVRHADRILHSQAAERNAAQAELQLERANLASQVAEQTADLRQLNTRLVRASKLKNQFLAMISHELRTPLTTILARTDALRLGVYGHLTDVQNTVVEGIRIGGTHLQGLVSDLLDMSMTETDNITIEKKPVQLEKLCRESLATIDAIVNQKELRVSLTLGKNVSILSGDERRLRQILINLLHNAGKFTPHGGLIGLDVSADVEQENVTLTVWDTGIGIPEDELTHIFAPFTQVDGRLAREYEGAGLGLALVKRLARLHGGEVSVQSTVGQGSRFSVVLPWMPEQEVLPVEAPVLQENDQSPLILIAEDNSLNAETLIDSLNYSGFRTSWAVNGLEAVDKAVAQLPDLILMDVQMPKLNGLDAIRKIRAEISHHIPIIVLTGFAKTNSRSLCLEAGADDYVSKPVSLESLSELVIQHL